MARARKSATEHDRDSKRIHVPFAAEEFAAIAKLADAGFGSLADTAHELALIGLEARNGEAPKVTGLAAAKETERDLRNRLLAIEVAKQEGEVLSVDQVIAFVQKEYGIIRSKLLQIPQSLMGASPEQVSDLKKIVQDVMTELSGEQRDAWDDMAAKQ